MGLFSGIKKAVKSVFSGIGKVFKKVLKPFAKILSNKFVKGILMAVAIFTTGGALLGALQAASASGAGFMGMLKAGVGEVVKLAVKAVTAPVELIAKGISGVGSVTGLQSLTSFGQSVSQGLGELANSAGNIFSGSASQTGQQLLSETNTSQITAQENIDFEGTGVDAAADAADTAEGAVGATEGASLNDAVSVADDTTNVAQPTVEVTNNDTSLLSDSAAVGGDESLGQSIIDSAQDAAQAEGEKGFFAKFSDALTDNPELTKLGGEMLQGAMQGDPNEGTTYEDYWKARKGNSFGSVKGDVDTQVRGQQGLYQENQELRDNAAQSKENFDKQRESIPGMLAQASEYSSNFTNRSDKLGTRRPTYNNRFGVQV